MTIKQNNKKAEERKIVGEVNKILSKYDACQEPFDEYRVSDELKNLKINSSEIEKESIQNCLKYRPDEAFLGQ